VLQCVAPPTDVPVMTSQSFLRGSRHKFEGSSTWCSVLQCVAMCCSVLQCVAGCCRVLQCVAVCCSMLQCVAVCCSVLIVCCSARHLKTTSRSFLRASDTNLRVLPSRETAASATSLFPRRLDLCCSVLHCAAVSDGVLQCVSACCVAVSCSVLQCVAARCSVLYCIAVCCVL